MSLPTRALPYLWLLAASVLGLTVSVPLEAQNEPSVRGSQGDGYHQIEATLPGRLEDFLLVPQIAGATEDEAKGEQLLLLVADADAPDEGPRQIFAFDGKGEGSLLVLARDLPAEVDRLLNLGSRGQGSSLMERVLAGTEDSLFRIVSGPGEPARLEPVLGDSAYHLGTRTSPMLPNGNSSGERSGRDPFRELARIRPGRLDVYRLDGTGLSLESTLPIPVRARRNRKSLFLESPPVTRLRSQEGSKKGSGAIYAVGPEAHGNRRLRTVLLDPQANGQVEPVESWSLLPGPETVENSWYGWKDGKPILVVTTFSADKIGIFERHRLRVYSLGTDRTRAGRRPLLETVTASRRWQDVRPTLLDVDGDSRDDLVVFQTEGMGDGKLIFEAFLGAPGSGFQLTSRRTVLDTQPSRWSYGNDLNGDGNADLVTLEKGSLEIFAGAGGAGRRSRHLVERKPSRTVTLGVPPEEESVTVDVVIGDDGTEAQMTVSEAGGSLRVADLDGDGIGEVLLMSDARAPRGTVRVFRFRS